MPPLSSNNGAQAPRLLSQAQAARYIGVGLTTFASLRRTPDFPAPVDLNPGSKHGKRWRPEDLDSWFDLRQSPTQAIGDTLVSDSGQVV